MALSRLDIASGSQVGQLTILTHRLSVWRADTQNDARKDVLEAGHEEERRVLRVLDIRFLLLEMRRNVPRLTLHCLKANGLNGTANNDLSEQWY